MFFKIKNRTYSFPNRFLLIVFVFLSITTAFTQNKLVYAKSFVKKNEIFIRWVPADKKVFDIAIKNGYKITRYERENNALIQPVVLNESLKPYSNQDTMAWAKLLQSSKSGIIAYKVLNADNKTNQKLSAEQITNEKMFYDLLLLSCDFESSIARAVGLYLRDSTVNNNRIYSYKIEINTQPASLKYTPVLIEVNANKLSKNPLITGLSGKFKNKKVKLTWKAIDFKNDFSAYNVERSTDSINYKKINSSPVILLSSQFEKKKDYITYDDTFPAVKIKYYYRIRGINHFGELSDPSNIVSGIGFEELKSFPVIDSIKVIQNQKVFVQFRMQDKKENLQPREYIIVRSKKDKGPYEKVFSSPTPSNYIDEKPESSNYYKAGAITYGGDTLYSFSYLALISDTIPPSPPKGLKAIVDTKGNVTLLWDKNPESDVQGYKVLKSNAMHEEFVQINNEFAREPKYNDKLNLKTLSKNIYYSVIATDKRYNNSVKCAPIEVKRPDTIAPVKPIVTNLEVKDKGIKVNWINSNSEDVKYYVLYRGEEKSLNEIKVREWLAKDSLNYLLDSTVVLGEGYRYRLLVSDEDDNISVSNNPYVKYETGYRKKLTEIKFEVDRTLKTVKLKWNYPEKEVEKFILYRAKKGAALTIVKTFPSKVSEFTDNTLNIGNIYEYRLKAVYSNGAEGIISDAIIVEY